MKKRKVLFGIPILTMVLTMFLTTSQLITTEAPIRGDDLFGEHPTETAKAPIKGIDIFSENSTIVVTAPKRGDDVF